MRASRLAALVAAVVWSFAAARARAETTDGPSPAADDGKAPWLAATLAGGTALLGYGTAVGLATGTDFDPFPVFLGSAAVGFLGPAAGHIYAGRNGHHAVGFALARVGFAAVGLLGIKELMSHDSIQAMNGESSGKANAPLAYTLLGISVAGVLGSTVWEAIDSYSCAQLPPGSRPTLTLSPVLLPSPTGAFASGGLVLSGRL